MSPTQQPIPASAKVNLDVAIALRDGVNARWSALSATKLVGLRTAEDRPSAFKALMSFRGELRQQRAIEIEELTGWAEKEIEHHEGRRWVMLFDAIRNETVRDMPCGCDPDDDCGHEPDGGQPPSRWCGGDPTSRIGWALRFHG